MKGIAVSLDELAKAQEQARHAIVGQLNAHIAEKHTTTFGSQTKAWMEELRLLCEAAGQFDATEASRVQLVLEYDIPRRQRRPDAVLVTETALVVVEFKIGAAAVDAAAIWQATSYALDLRDFHSCSAGLGIATLVVASGGRFATTTSEAGEIPVVMSDGSDLAQDIRRALGLARQRSTTARIDPKTWIDGKYQPTPTIVQAAEELYRGHGIAEINHAYAQNLTQTTDAIVEYVLRAREKGEHLACFVTGVPGAGKTLTGLNAVHDPRLNVGGHPEAIFLSGNGPLVEVIRAALVGARSGGREEAQRRVRTFIQNVHHFAREYEERPTDPPFEHVVIFDEAQRAWSAEKMLRARRGPISEPAQLVHIMERWSDWSVIVALVGGGQEIHDGEAGLSEWGDAIALASRKKWTVVASPEAIEGGVAVSGHKLFRGKPGPSLQILADDRLHLRISVRSPRARLLAEWVDAVLDGDSQRAHTRASAIRDFPLVATRDLRVARAWLRARSADGKRAGLLASAGARRLRAYGVQLSTQVGQNSDVDQWFLAPPDDVRSSNCLEVAATEFECQGLEVDLAGLCWGDDFTWNGNGWDYKKFRGSEWLPVRESEDRQYMRNKYRVLLTRARVGMLIWVPPGSIEDTTRPPAPLDRTWEFLLACGVKRIGADVVEYSGPVGPTVTFGVG